MPTSGNTNYDKLLEYFNNQKMSLEELEEQYSHLLESIWSHETSLEHIKRLQNEVNELQNEYNDFLNKGNNKKIVDKYADRLSKLEKIKEIEEELNRLNGAGKLHTKKAQKLQKNLAKIKQQVNDIDDAFLKLGVTVEEAGEKHEKANKLQIDLTRKLIEEQKELNRRQEEGITVLDDWSEVAERNTKAFRKGAGEVSKGAKQIFDSIAKTLEPWRKANHEAMAYAKTMGMSQKTADAYLQKTVSWAAKNNIGILFNKTTDELIKMQGKYSDVLGRNVQLTSEQKKDMLAMETFLGEDGMMDIANNLENFGLGMSDSADFIKETMDEATKSGIAASKLTKTIRENIKMAQNYTFKDGLKSLESMAKKAIQLKADMSLINSFAEKTSTVEGAIQTGAQLQVLGGSYALGSDPLSMMYESLNDMEGLFDRAVTMAQGKVHYNSQTGNFEMGAMDRYMMKQAATAMGVDPSKMIDVAFRQASLDKIEGQAKLNSNIAGDNEMLEMVKNLATWDKGKAVIDIDGKETAVSALTKDDKSKLEAMQRTDSQNLQDMAISLRSMNDIMSGTQKEINNEQANATHGIAQSIDNLLGNSTKTLDIIAKIGAWGNIIGGALGILGGVWATAAGVLRMGKGIGNIFNGGKPTSTGSGGGPTPGSNKPLKPGILGNGFTKADFKGGLRENIITHNGKTYRDLGGGRLQNVNGGKAFGGRAAQSIINNGVRSKGWTNLAKAAGKGMKVGGAMALVGSAISIGSDIATGEFKKDVGGSIGRAVGPAIGSIVGGIFGPVGAMVGGFLGNVITSGIQKAQKKNRDKIRNRIADELSSTMPSVAKLFNGNDPLQGNYNKRQLSRLKDALADGKISEGELSNSILRKARANGDLVRMRNQGINVEIPLAKGGKLEGNSHAEGGMPILGSNIVVEGGEYVVNKKATKENLPLLEKINSGDYKMIAKEPLGKISKVLPNHQSEGSIMPHNSKIEVSPVSVNLSGTIKLDLGSNKQIDISDDLINNPIFVHKITEMISKEININNNGAYHKRSFLQKFV